MSDEPAGTEQPAPELPAAEASAPAPAEAPGQKLWYVLKVTSNREKSIRDNLVRRMKREGLEEFFGEIKIPTERIVETKGGKKKVTERKLYPGYLMIQMVLNDETWYLVRETTGVGDFTGAARKPLPMQDHEIARMIGADAAKQVEPTKVRIDFARGDKVKIKDGSFENWEGSIDSIDETHGKVTVMVDILGRSTPVELEYWQLESV